MKLESDKKEAKRDWFQKICLRLATIQNWMLYLYRAKKEIDREDCNNATYSIMRVLDHNEEEWETFFKGWKQKGWETPKILW